MSYLDRNGLSYLWGKLKSFFVRKDGDTMTGNLNIASQDMGRGSDPSGGYIYPGGFDIKDATGGGASYVFLQPCALGSGSSLREGFQLGTSRDVSGETKYSSVQMTMSPTGAVAVSFDHPAAWRSGLGTISVGSASAGTAISADDITAWTANTPTSVTPKTVVTGVTKKTVVTGGSTTDVPNISKKTVVTSASGATASVSGGVLTITDGSFSTGDSVTVGTAIKAYTSLSTGDSVTVTTGDSCTVTAGTAASLSYTSRSIPNISVSSKTVVGG